MMERCGCACGNILQLASDIKNYLNITWDDQAENSKIINLVNSGISYINSKYGGTADYYSPGFPRTLIFEYVRYARDNALDVFEQNYTAMILAMQTEKAVSDIV